jgi:hypothetical protein
MTRARGESPRDFCHTRAAYREVHWSMFAVVSSWDAHFMKLRELITYRRGWRLPLCRMALRVVAGGAGDGKGRC